MKALTVRQPWAWAIMSGVKRVENRSWSTAYRGPLAIIAGRSHADMGDGVPFLHEHRMVVPVDELAFGCILGVVTLTDVLPVEHVDDRFAEGPFCWLLADPVPLKRPVPWRGSLRLAELPANILE